MVGLASTGQLTTTTMEFCDIALQEDKHKNNNEKWKPNDYSGKRTHGRKKKYSDNGSDHGLIKSAVTPASQSHLAHANFFRNSDRSMICISSGSYFFQKKKHILRPTKIRSPKVTGLSVFKQSYIQEIGNNAFIIFTQ
jgi:hypothetical protein